MGNSKGKMKLFAILAVTATATPFVKPSCQDQCMEWAKKEASKNCKKGDDECMNKYKQMGKKCVNEKCNDFAEFVEAWRSHPAKISALHGPRSKHPKNAKRATKNACKNSKKLERNVLLKSVTLFLTLKNSKSHLAKINAWHGPKKKLPKNAKRATRIAWKNLQKWAKNA